MWRFLKKLEIELPYDPAIPLLGIHTKETRIERDTCTPMFIAALFTIARTWMQPRCPSADEWIRKLWYVYMMEYYSAIKKNAFESVLIIPIPKKGNPKECSNYSTISLISHASKVMLKILQARLQQYMNHELPDVQAGFRKGRRTRDQIANICWVIEKAREFQKSIYFCFINYAKSLDCVDHNKLWKIL